MKQTNKEKPAGAMLRLPKPKPRLGAATESKEPLVWDSRHVQKLIARVGEKAEVLVIGRREAEALENYLRTSFPGEEVSLHDYRYAGLRVVVVGDESCIRVETVNSIYESSRHALLRKHEKRRPTGLVRKVLGKARTLFG